MDLCIGSSLGCRGLDFGVQVLNLGHGASPRFSDLHIISMLLRTLKPIQAAIPADRQP